MLLVQSGAFYSDELEGRHQQSIGALPLVRKAAVTRWRWGAFSWRKWSRATEALYPVRSALTLVLRVLNPGGLAPLQSKGAPATSKMELLLVRDEGTPDQRGAYIDKRYSVTSQKGAITGQQGRRRRSYMVPC